MDAKPLDWLLDTLARADCFADPDDRAACERTADALRDRLGKINGPVRVVLVHGPDADPLVYDLEIISQAVDEWGDQLRIIGGMVDELRTEVVERRKRITAERDSLRAEIKAFLDSVDVDLPDLPWPTQGWLSEELELLRRAVKEPPDA